MTREEFINTLVADYWTSVDNGTSDEPVAANYTVVCNGEGCDPTPRECIFNVPRDAAQLTVYCVCGNVITDAVMWGYNGEAFTS